MPASASLDNTTIYRGASEVSWYMKSTTLKHVADVSMNLHRSKLKHAVNG